ncbi:DUF2164 domain-containing protein [Ferrimonas balearica]|uniref:DUF2164 domain-containing protein n=1 Tax=Ferrimonas balearica TaxID=44012 RepID=UPI001C99C193|nr:DUF2164 domain-containing protein [Ferrimonas balearica]MBY5993195.1 DUF2164 domain-containing protein [Ferrimonas balearica]
MASIELTPEVRHTLLTQLSDYCDRELERELGQFEAEFLLDFLIAKLGPVLYNQALYDAQALMQTRVDALVESLYELEKPAD